MHRCTVALFKVTVIRMDSFRITLQFELKSNSKTANAVKRKGKKHCVVFCLFVFTRFAFINAIYKIRFFLIVRIKTTRIFLRNLSNKCRTEWLKVDFEHNWNKDWSLMIYFMVWKSLLSSTLDLQNHSHNSHYSLCVLYFARNKIEKVFFF